MNKLFVVSPRFGLCNQLQSIVKCILLGIKYNRHVYIDKFQTNLFSGDNSLCDINEVLDIENINLFLSTFTETRINKTNNSDVVHRIPELDYDRISETKFINDVLENNKNVPTIYLGNIVSLCIFQSFGYHWDDYGNLYYVLMSKLRFMPIFYRMRDTVKRKLRLVNYACVHLRIEDDALQHFSNCYGLSVNEYNRLLLSFYIKQLRLLSQPIYVSSGILEYNNEINKQTYLDLCRQNNWLRDKRDITDDDILPYYRKNRELIAIVDLLIAYDSQYFIGSCISSFSRLIEAYLINKDVKKRKNIKLFMYP